MKDLTFIENDGMFNVRAAVIVEHNNRTLIQTMDDYMWLVGGRVHMGEDSRTAIIREIAEELCYTPTGDDKLGLNFICENFFMWDNTPCHEILFVYRLTLGDKSDLIGRDNFKCGDNDKFIETWIRFDDLKNTKLVPKFIKEYIDHREFKYMLIRD